MRRQNAVFDSRLLGNIFANHFLSPATPVKPDGNWKVEFLSIRLSISRSPNRVVDLAFRREPQTRVTIPSRSFQGFQY